MKTRIASLVLLISCGHLSSTWAADIKPVQCPGKAAPANAIDEYQRLWLSLCVDNIPFLESAFSKLQSDFETEVDPRYIKGSWFFMFDDSSLPPELVESWLKKYPRSYTAHLAKGLYEFDKGMDARGSKFANETTDEQFQQMYKHFVVAREALDASINLTTKPYLTYRTYIRMGKHGEQRARIRSYFNKASSIAPTALGAWLDYMESLQPRWGGSFAQMLAFAEEAGKAGLPAGDVNRLRALAWWDKSQYGYHRGNADETRLADAVKANEYYETSQYLKYIVEMKFYLKRHKEAMPEINRAIELSPKWADLYRLRGIVYFVNDNDAAAYKDFLISANDGNAFSQNKVGYYLWHGKDVPKDQAEATQWFKKSAAQGDEIGKKNLELAQSKGFK